MKLKNSTRPVRVALGLFLIGLVVVPNVLNCEQRSRAQTTQTTETPQTNASASEASLVRQYLEGMQKLRTAELTPEARAQLAQEMAQKRTELRELRKQMRLARGILPFGPPPGGHQGSGAKRTAPAPATGGDGRKAQSAEKCAACKFVWVQIKGDVANAKFIQEVQAAFTHNCANAQKSTIFYEACEDMYDDMYAMTDDYMTNSDTIVCEKAGLCPTK